MSGALLGRRIAFIGGGIMGEAIIRGLLKVGAAVPEQIIVSDPVPERVSALREALGVQATGDNLVAVRDANIVVFAVKPQVLGAVLEGLRGYIPSTVLIITIVAGAPIARFTEALDTRAVVRVIPNTPGQIGEGVSLWTDTPETTEEQRSQARALLAALGVEVHGHNEDEVDMATAISGSGPAYVFLFIEALTDAGVQMGLSRDVASTLALQTVLGSAAYARDAGLHPAILRNRVTSPGGTTAAALYELEAGGLRATITRAALAAYRQAQRLGGAS
jgi:pyrroline-5-carboxylate reductase